ncbi:acylpyruvase FAHD1, mitochondrial [Condylostylus longicornis]|uniref:acylpyruvase FAHD1, mitochondrial n=1 Tax=Condylostylus longicornis TaxID=2530218 RepID=UPI00244DE6D5|nr:acylpyruvase FAHD1, mitochondrial [Condylostylus longicornis]
MYSLSLSNFFKAFLVNNIISSSTSCHICLRKMSLSKNKNFVNDGKKIIGAALNYMDIVKARNVPVPKSPVVFLKPTSSYITEGQNIILPKEFTRVAYEVELGVIIGKACKNVKKEDAMNYVAGYCLALDLTAQCELTSAREKGMPWSIGKGFDTATPVSRLISLEEISDPHNVGLWLKHNEELKQEGNTKDLIFKVPDLISYISKYMTLEENDLILTGTPDGSAAMKQGDVIECGIPNLITVKFNVN